MNGVDRRDGFTQHLNASLVPVSFNLRAHRYEGDAEDLCLSFAVEDDTFGRRTSVPLVPGGDSIAVTSANKLQYVQLLAEWHLNGRAGPPAAAFARGLTQVTRSGCPGCIFGLRYFRGRGVTHCIPVVARMPSATLYMVPFSKHVHQNLAHAVWLLLACSDDWNGQCACNHFRDDRQSKPASNPLLI